MRLPLAIPITFIALMCVVAGCSARGSASQGADAPLKVEISGMFITVKNDSGMPLTDINVGIVPPTRTTVYTKFLGRLENSEARDLMIGDFSGRDGTPLNLRVVKPKSVEIKGTGADGKIYSVTVPWK